MQLRHIGTALKGFRIQLEQLDADIFGKACAFLVRAQVDQIEAVPPGGSAEGTLDAVCSPFVFKGQVAAAFSAAPGKILLSLVLIQRLGRPWEPVEHGPDELGQRGLAEAVGLMDHRQAVPEFQVIAPEAAEIFYV